MFFIGQGLFQSSRNLKQFSLSDSWVVQNQSKPRPQASWKFVAMCDRFVWLVFSVLFDYIKHKIPVSVICGKKRIYIFYCFYKISLVPNDALAIKHHCFPMAVCSILWYLLFGRFTGCSEIALTILPDVEDLIEASILHTPIAQKLRMCSAQVDLLTGQFVKGCIQVWLNVVGTKFVEYSVLLLRPSWDWGPGLLKERKNTWYNRHPVIITSDTQLKILPFYSSLK